MLTEDLKVLLASVNSLSIKAQNFHWNVEGASFPQLHVLFEKIYDEVYDSIDTFAEQIRALQMYTPASLQKFSMLTKVEDENAEGMDAGQMVAELLQDSEKMAGIFKLVFAMAEQAGDHGLSNFFADRQDAHKKHSWMLRSTLK
jgi:starvation-inducible DNA-binding protein